MFKITAEEQGFIISQRMVARKVPELYDWANKLSRIKAKEFIQRFGKSVGKGSSRMVYKKGKFIIKRAMNQLGIEQNEKQEEVWRMGFQDSRKLLAPVYAISDDGRVLIMGYAKPFRSFSKATKRKIGIGIKELSDTRRKYLTSEEVLSGEKWDFLGNWDWGPNNLASYHLKGGGRGFGGDFVRPSSWGVMGNRIVLTDYGF